MGLWLRKKNIPQSYYIKRFMMLWSLYKIKKINVGSFLSLWLFLFPGIQFICKFTNITEINSNHKHWIRMKQKSKWLFKPYFFDKRPGLQLRNNFRERRFLFFSSLFFLLFFKIDVIDIYIYTYRPLNESMISKFKRRKYL